MLITKILNPIREVRPKVRARIHVHRVLEILILISLFH